MTKTNEQCCQEPLAPPQKKKRQNPKSLPHNKPPIMTASTMRMPLLMATKRTTTALRFQQLSSCTIHSPYTRRSFSTTIQQDDAFVLSHPSSVADPKTATRGRVVCITSGKGGVGKTTSAASFALGLAQRGRKTCVVDFDVGLRNLGKYTV